MGPPLITFPVMRMRPLFLFVAFVVGGFSTYLVIFTVGDPFAPRVTTQAGGANVLYIAPPTTSRFTVTYHAPSELKAMGDKDGLDYVPMKFVSGQLRVFRSNGTSNEDFFGFGMPVLAPIAGVVSQVKPPNGVNPLGQMGTTEVGFIGIKSDDGANLIMAHLAEICVTQGQRVRIGDPIGIISNNGYCRHPHIHLGAYRAGRSLIIEFDRNQLDATFSKYRDSELNSYR